MTPRGGVGAHGAPLLAVVGATASGKTRLAVAFAAAAPAPVEVLSCDSMAVYRGLDVSAAKPSRAERASVRHHLLDIADPRDAFTVHDYLVAYERARADVAARGAAALLVGGSGLHFRAAVDGLALAPTDPDVRGRLAREDPGVLYERLRAADPDAATRIDPRNARRVRRAAEILEITGRAPSELRRQWDRSGEVAAVALSWPRTELYARVESRIDRMLAAGMVGEIARVHAAGLGPTAAQGVGVKEIVEHLEGRLSLEEARALVLRNTKRFVRRQDSWFRADPRVRWIDVTEATWDAARDEAIGVLAAALVRQ